MAAGGLLLGQAARLGAPPFVAWALAAGALTAPVVALRHRRWGGVALIGSAATLVGLLQAGWYTTTRDAAATENEDGASRRLEGRIDAIRLREGRPGERGLRLDLTLTRVESESAEIHAGARVRVSVWRAVGEWREGEHVGLTTALRRPRGFCNAGADRYARALGRAGIVAVGGVAADAAIDRLPDPVGPTPARGILAAGRGAVGRAIGRALGPAEAAVLRALVTGDQGDLPEAVRQAYSRTGTSHVLSVSGLHIAIVAGAAYQTAFLGLALVRPIAARMVVARLAALVALLPAGMYAVFSGGAVATVRSLLMAAAFLGAIVVQRRGDLVTAIAASALLICGLDPEACLDVSFQLSFASVVGIVVGMERLAGSQLGSWLRAAPGSGLGGRLRASLWGAVGVSLAAGLATAPLTATYFGTLSLIGPVANLVVVPLVGWLALFCGLAGAALLPLWEVGATLTFAAGGVMIRLANAIVEWLAGLPGAALQVAPPSGLESGLWTVAISGLAVRGRRTRRALLGVGLVGALGLPVAIRALDAGEMQIRFLDVGQGDAAIVALPRGGSIWVIDGGGLGGGYDPGEGVVVPALREHRGSRIAAVVLSHPQLDHYGGLAAVVRGSSPAELWSTGQGATSATFAGFEKALDAARVRRRVASGPAKLLVGPQAEIEALHPPAGYSARRPNDASLVIAVRHGAVRALFTGDVELPAEQEMLASEVDLWAAIVKVAHHGSRTSSSERFLRTVRPALAVAGIGLRNRFHFPAAEVPARYRRLGAAWLQTDRDGEVAVDSDGQIARVRTCRSLGANEATQGGVGTERGASPRPPRAQGEP